MKCDENLYQFMRAVINKIDEKRTKRNEKKNDYRTFRIV